MKTPLAVLTSAALLLGAVAPAFAQSAPSAPASSGCQFVLGFKTLHDLDASDVGDCVDNQATVSNGDAQQHTTNGLMVWRKADNWTAFTNGYMTWINGPDGLQSRLNSDRFPWEAGGSSDSSTASSPAPSASASPSPAPAGPSNAAGQAAGPLITTSGPDDSKPLGDAPAGGFVPITLPSGCSAYLTVQDRFDPNDKSPAQPNGRTWKQITPHLSCNGQDTDISSLPAATLDAACQDSLTKYQAQTSSQGMILTAKDYLCPKLNDPFFLN
ncbi:MAG TPA: hypothetical protein VK009_00520 [Chloroflexota bacterium]|nr:hypothetical protein [Chloroflexota bacterium]